MKKLIYFILASFLLLSATSCNAKFMNKFKDGFYFEKYKTAKKAKEELLKIHPIGSGVDDLINTLEGAGAVVKESNLDLYKKFKKYDHLWQSGIVKAYDYGYKQKNLILLYSWGGMIKIDKNNKIISYGVSKNPEAI